MTAIAPYLGYLAFVFLAVSLIVKSPAQFRVYNAAGSVCFIIYGTILQAWPVVLTNATLLVINLWYIGKMVRSEEGFQWKNQKPDQR